MKTHNVVVNFNVHSPTLYHIPRRAVRNLASIMVVLGQIPSQVA